MGKTERLDAQSVSVLAEEILGLFDERVTYKTAVMALEQAREMLDDHSTVSLDLFPIVEGDENVNEMWTGQLIGRMHVHDITYDDLASEVGWGKAYVGMILNGQRKPKGAKEKLEAAVASIIKRRQADKTDN